MSQGQRSFPVPPPSGQRSVPLPPQGGASAGAAPSKPPVPQKDATRKSNVPPIPQRTSVRDMLPHTAPSSPSQLLNLQTISPPQQQPLLPTSQPSTAPIQHTTPYPIVKQTSQPSMVPPGPAATSPPLVRTATTSAVPIPRPAQQQTSPQNSPIIPFVQSSHIDDQPDKILALQTRFNISGDQMEDTKKLFAKMDVNCDGLISFSDFLRFSYDPVLQDATNKRTLQAKVRRQSTRSGSQALEEVDSLLGAIISETSSGRSSLSNTPIPSPALSRQSSTGSITFGSPRVPGGRLDEDHIEPPSPRAPFTTVYTALTPPSLSVDEDSQSSNQPEPEPEPEPPISATSEAGSNAAPVAAIPVISEQPTPIPAPEEKPIVAEPASIAPQAFVAPVHDDQPTIKAVSRLPSRPRSTVLTGTAPGVATSQAGASAAAPSASQASFAPFNASAPVFTDTPALAPVATVAPKSDVAPVPSGQVAPPMPQQPVATTSPLKRPVPVPPARPKSGVTPLRPPAPVAPPKPQPMTIPASVQQHEAESRHEQQIPAQEHASTSVAQQLEPHAAKDPAEVSPSGIGSGADQQKPTELASGHRKQTSLDHLVIMDDSIGSNRAVSLTEIVQKVEMEGLSESDEEALSPRSEPGAVEEPKQGFNFRNLDWEKINQAIEENPDNSDDDNHLEDWDKPRQHTAEELAELEPKTGDGGHSTPPRSTSPALASSDSSSGAKETKEKRSFFRTLSSKFKKATIKAPNAKDEKK